MDNKQRLYEVFAKVNKMPLNEQNYLDDTQEMDDLHDEITAQVKMHFDPKTFRDGVPTEMTLRMFDQDVPIQIAEDQGLTFEGMIEDQHHYRAHYIGTVNNVVFNVFVEIYVDLDMTYTHQKYEFIPKIISDDNQVTVDFRE